MKKLLIILGMLAVSMPIVAQDTYTNPVINENLPDPCVLQDGDTYYLYATESKKNLPIYSSTNLVDWKFVGNAFTQKSRPSHLENGQLWAPDVKKINEKYVLAYSESRWLENKENGIGIAISNSPVGPFEDQGLLFTSQEIGVGNSIDPSLYEENGELYLIWGSMGGIYIINLDKETLKIKTGANKLKIAGQGIEGSHIFKHGNYYYLFASTGSCCKGKDSTYRVIVGRSKNLMGPYTNYEGSLLDKEASNLVISGNEKFVGTGHGSSIITDKNGDTWYIYHSYLRNESGKGRLVLLDKIEWTEDGWPFINTGTPSTKSNSRPKL